MDTAQTTAIIFVGRLSARTLVHAELKARGVGHVVTCDDLQACLSALSTYPKALLFLDSDQDERELVQVLRSAQGRYRIDTRPIYLFPYLPSEKILAYAVEYNITQLHAGEISKAQVEVNLSEMLRYGTRSDLQLEIYDMVIKARLADRKDEVHALLHSLWRAEPDNIQAGDELGFSMCEMDLWSEAEEHLVAIIARFPFDTRAKHLLARCFMKKSDYSKARYYLEQASLLSPFNAERLCDLAQIFLDQYQVAEALGTFHEALLSDPDLHEARIGKTTCELLLGEANDALKIMRQLQDPFDFASVFNGAAITSVRAGHYSQGIGLYKTAAGYLAEYPNLMSRVFFNMGIGLYKWGKGQLAIAAFQKALEWDASNEKAKHNADRLAIKFKRNNRLAKEGLEGPFSALNRIDTMDDFDEISEEGFDSRGSTS